MATKSLVGTLVVSMTALLAACGTSTGSFLKSKVIAQAPSETDVRPKTRPDDPSQSVVAATPETDVIENTKPTERPEQDKGTTIASLGLLDQDGFWLSTTLVTTQTKGRVVVEKTGASVNVTLIPNGGATGSGSQLSIAAMKVLGVPITSLVEVRVFIR